jgi:hypothetical protein
MNPPYKKIMPWVEKASKEANGTTKIVGLLPANPDTKWFRYLLQFADVLLLPKRVAFLNEKKIPVRGNPRASMAAIWPGTGQITLWKTAEW